MKCGRRGPPVPITSYLLPKRHSLKQLTVRPRRQDPVQQLLDEVSVLHELLADEVAGVDAGEDDDGLDDAEEDEHQAGDEAEQGSVDAIVIFAVEFVKFA